jgi:hypothetical protein
MGPLAPFETADRLPWHLRTASHLFLSPSLVFTGSNEPFPESARRSAVNATDPAWVLAPAMGR